MAWANKMTTPTTVSIFVSMQPVAAFVFSLLILHQFPSLGEAVGGIVIIMSLIWFAKARHVPSKEIVSGRLPDGENGEKLAACGKRSEAECYMQSHGFLQRE